jgi:hypothetical protein
MTKLKRIFFISALLFIYFFYYPKVTQASLSVNNPGFENGTANWWVWDPSGGNNTNFVVTGNNPATSGSKSAKITLGPNTCPSSICGDNNTIIACVGQGRQRWQNSSMWTPSLWANKTFQFSYWFKPNSNSVRTRMQIALRKQDNSLVTYWLPGVFGSSAGVGTWQRMVKNVTIPATYEGQNVTAIDIVVCVLGYENDEAFIDDVNIAEVIPSPTLTPTPTINPNCHCVLNTNNCSTSCNFSSYSSFSYNAPFRCLPSESLFSIIPTGWDWRNSGCQRPERGRGDADGNGVINTLDYMYYVSAVNGGRIHYSINPDFNGDGEVGFSDREIIIKSLSST